MATTPPILITPDFLLPCSATANPAMQITSTVYNCNHAKWFPTGFAGGPSGPLQLIVASWVGSQSTPPTGPYGLSALDLTPLGITF